MQNVGQIMIEIYIFFEVKHTTREIVTVLDNSDLSIVTIPDFVTIMNIKKW